MTCQEPFKGDMQDAARLIEHRVPPHLLPKPVFTREEFLPPLLTQGMVF